MRRKFKNNRSFSDEVYCPFENGEEAWMWFSRCQLVRNEGARFIAGLSDTPRPCEPDDVYRSVMVLFQKRNIDHKHLQVLGSYGARLESPNVKIEEEREDAVLWETALEQLSEILRQKGIVYE